MGHEAMFSQTGVDMITGLESKVRRVRRVLTVLLLPSHVYITKYRLLHALQWRTQVLRDHLSRCITSFVLVRQVATVFGRPKWDKIFTDIKKKHPGKRVGVFVCGPPVSSLTARRSRQDSSCQNRGCACSQPSHAACGPHR